MATTLAQMRSYVRSQTLVQADDVSNAILDQHLNSGLNQLSLAFSWPWLQASADLTTVQDQQFVAVPSDFRKAFLIIENDTRVKLQEITFEQAFLQWGGDPPSGDGATWYYLFANQINFVPIPASAEAAEYKIYYQKAITELSADGDSPEFVSEFHLLPTQYAIARVWEHEEDFSKAAEADTAFRERVEQMARYYTSLTESKPMVFGDGVSPRMSPNVNMPWMDLAT